AVMRGEVQQSQQETELSGDAGVGTLTLTARPRVRWTGHILLCGSLAQAKSFVEVLRRVEKVDEHCTVVVLTQDALGAEINGEMEGDGLSALGDVHLIEGCSSSPSDLERACHRHAKAVVAEQLVAGADSSVNDADALLFLYGMEATSRQACQRRPEETSPPLGGSAESVYGKPAGDDASVASSVLSSKVGHQEGLQEFDGHPIAVLKYSSSTRFLQMGLLQSARRCHPVESKLRWNRSAMYTGGTPQEWERQLAELKIPEWQLHPEYTAGHVYLAGLHQTLASQCVLLRSGSQAGVLKKVIEQMVGEKGAGGPLCLLPIEKSLIGRPYSQLVSLCARRGQVALGLYRRSSQNVHPNAQSDSAPYVRYVCTCPNRRTLLDKHDFVYVVQPYWGRAPTEGNSANESDTKLLPD
ncbi:hypothetical protein CYMTET_13350, partial [Cymbomonas tetramitiformis]